jgi:hypothetical protein
MGTRCAVGHFFFPQYSNDLMIALNCSTGLLVVAYPGGVLPAPHILKTELIHCASKYAVSTPPSPINLFHFFLYAGQISSNTYPMLGVWWMSLTSWQILIHFFFPPFFPTTRDQVFEFLQHQQLEQGWDVDRQTISALRSS